MPGPLPNPTRRRTNAPTIPTTNLPASGRQGPAPRPPKWITLGEAGRAWWAWAWKTPAAAAWSANDLVTIARRASLEDDVAAIGEVQGLDFEDAADAGVKELLRLVRQLSGVASGKMALVREMRELDDRLGLTPKGMAALRWKIVADDAAPSKASKPSKPGQVTSIEDARWARLLDADAG